MKCLTILKGQELKISVKNKIKENDIFIEEYREAAKKLNEIIYSSQMDKGQDKVETGFQTNCSAPS